MGMKTLELNVKELNVKEPKGDLLCHTHRKFRINIIYCLLRTSILQNFTY